MSLNGTEIFLLLIICGSVPTLKLLYDDYNSYLTVSVYPQFVSKSLNHVQKKNHVINLLQKPVYPQATVEETYLSCKIVEKKSI